MNAVAAVSPLWKPANSVNTPPITTVVTTPTPSGSTPQPPGVNSLPASVNNSTATETSMSASTFDTTQSYDFFFGNNNDYNSNLVSSRTIPSSTIPNNTTSLSSNQLTMLASSPVVNSNSASINNSEIEIDTKVDTHRKQIKENVNPADRIAARLEALSLKKS